MKKVAAFVIALLIVCVIAYYQSPIVSFVFREIVYKFELTEYKTNAYYKDIDYKYVSITDDFYVENENDIKNVIYTILNSGMTNYSFFCKSGYKNCLSDVEKIAADSNVLSNINNFVHPYNSYDKLYISTNTFGKIDIKVDKLYSESEILDINNKLHAIESSIFTSNMSIREKIKALHDYIINNTVYDIKRAEELNQSTYDRNENQSHKANGVLNEHIALCSGYTDLMAIFLSDIGIPNYKISTNNHVWNAVYLDNNWYHLDLTWDDPVGQNILIDDFFLITTSKLQQLDKTQHQYDKTVYGF